MRYLFNFGWIALQESIVYMHGFLFMLAAAYTLKHDGHVRVDIFYRPASQRKKAIINIAGILLLLLPVTIFIFAISLEYVIASWLILESSQEAGGLEARFILKSVLLLMPVLVILQGIAELFRNILVLQQQKRLPQAEESAP